MSEALTAAALAAAYAAVWRAAVLRGRRERAAAARLARRSRRPINQVVRILTDGPAWRFDDDALGLIELDRLEVTLVGSPDYVEAF